MRVSKLKIKFDRADHMIERLRIDVEMMRKYSPAARAAHWSKQDFATFTYLKFLTFARSDLPRAIALELGLARENVPKSDLRVWKQLSKQARHLTVGEIAKAREKLISFRAKYSKS